MFGVESGWYTFDSVANWAPESAGDVEIKAGEMFQIGSDCGKDGRLASESFEAESRTRLFEILKSKGIGRGTRQDCW